MAFYIKDGTGSGAVASVSESNKLRTSATYEPASAYYSRQGRLFLVTTINMPVPGDDTYRDVLWVRNDSVSDNFYYQRISYVWDGGATTRNEVLTVQAMQNTTEPTVNNLTFGPFSLNSSVPYNEQMTVHLWDGGANSGMGFGGNAISTTYVPVGLQIIPSDGEIILGPGQTAALRCKATEAGNATLSITGWFSDPNDRSL